jgi:hypothetical protein
MIFRIATRALLLIILACAIWLVIMVMTARTCRDWNPFHCSSPDPELVKLIH